MERNGQKLSPNNDKNIIINYLDKTSKKHTMKFGNNGKSGEITAPK